MVRRAFEDFAQFLDNRDHGDDAEADLRSMGMAYVAYSMKHPLYYRLMFNTALPNPQDHPEMMEKAQFAFDMLINGIRAVHATRFPEQVDARSEKDAFFIWSSLHGLCSIMESDAIENLRADPGGRAEIVEAIFERLGWAMNHDASIST